LRAVSGHEIAHGHRGLPTLGLNLANHLFRSASVPPVDDNLDTFQSQHPAYLGPNPRTAAGDQRSLVGQL
jgi:hypothetical protein